MKGTTVETADRRETARAQVMLDETSRALVESKRQLMAQSAQVAMWLDGRDGPASAPPDASAWKDSSADARIKPINAKKARGQTTTGKRHKVTVSKHARKGSEQ